MDPEDCGSLAWVALGLRQWLRSWPLGYWMEQAQGSENVDATGCQGCMASSEWVRRGARV